MLPWNLITNFLLDVFIHGAINRLHSTQRDGILTHLCFSRRHLWIHWLTTTFACSECSPNCCQSKLQNGVRLLLVPKLCPDVVQFLSQRLVRTPDLRMRLRRHGQQQSGISPEVSLLLRRLCSLILRRSRNRNQSQTGNYGLQPVSSAVARNCRRHQRLQISFGWVCAGMSHLRTPRVKSRAGKGVIRRIRDHIRRAFHFIYRPFHPQCML